MSKKSQASDAANVDIWMPVYIQKWLAAVTRLDRADTGSYMQAILYHWAYGPLPADLEEVCRIMKIDMGDASSITQASPKHPFSIALALLKKFFVQGDDGTWVQPSNQRIKEEWSGKRRVFNERAKKAAEARWKEKRTKKDASSIPQAMPEVMLEECPVSVSLPVSASTNPPVVPPPSAGGAPPAARPNGSEAEANKEKKPSSPRRSRKGGGVGNGSKLEAARARTLGFEGKKPHPMLAKHPAKTPDRRTDAFKSEIVDCYCDMNGLDKDKQEDRYKVPWGRLADRALKGMLDASSISMGDLRRCLEHRAISVGAGEFSPSTLPESWVRKLPGFLAVPLNRHGDPLPPKRKPLG